MKEFDRSVHGTNSRHREERRGVGAVYAHTPDARGELIDNPAEWASNG